MKKKKKNEIKNEEKMKKISLWPPILFFARKYFFSSNFTKQVLDPESDRLDPTPE